MVFGKKPADWIREGGECLRKGKLSEAMEHFKRAYSESEKEKREDAHRIKATCLEGMGRVYCCQEDYENALHCFEEGLSLILAAKGLGEDPLSGEVSDEKLGQVFDDPLVYMLYADKAVVLKNLAIKKGGEVFNELVQKSRKITDQLLKSIPMTQTHMAIANQLARLRYNLMFVLAQRKSPQDFISDEQGVVYSLDLVEKTYRELGYTEAQIAFDFEMIGVRQSQKTNRGFY